MSRYESFLLLTMFRMLLHSSSGAGDCMWVYWSVMIDVCALVSCLLVSVYLWVYWFVVTHLYIQVWVYVCMNICNSSSVMALNKSTSYIFFVVFTLQFLHMYSLFIHTVWKFFFWTIMRLPTSYNKNTFYLSCVCLLQLKPQLCKKHGICVYGDIAERLNVFHDWHLFRVHDEVIFCFEKLVFQNCDIEAP